MSKRNLHFETRDPPCIQYFIYNEETVCSILFWYVGVEAGHQIDSHVNYLDKSESSPLHLAVRGGNIETIRLCISYGGKIDQQQVLISQIPPKNEHVNV